MKHSLHSTRLCLLSAIASSLLVRPALAQVQTLNCSDGQLDNFGCLTSTNTSNGYSIYGTSSSGDAIYGQSQGAGHSGVVGLGPNGSGVFGNGAAYGIYGTTTNGYPSVGVYGTSRVSTGVGVEGNVSGGTGVEGVTQTGNGVAGGTTGGSGGIGVFGWTQGSNGKAIFGGNYGDGSNYAGYFQGNVDVEGQFQSNGVCQFGCGSDERIKKNIAPLKGALNKLLELRGVTFEYKNPEGQGKGSTGIQIGFVAQQVENVFPRWVAENGEGFKMLTIQPNQIAALEVESIRALKLDNDELKARLKVLEDARHPAVSMGANGLGLAVGGIAIAGALAASRRKREGEGEKNE